MYIIFIIIIFFILLYLFLPFTENFSDNLDIEYYVITSKNDIRLKNIEEQQKKINNNINIQKIDAVMGINLDLNKLVVDKILSHKFLSDDSRKRGQIGCYMSHLNIYDIIKTKNINGYSIIFEDDFIITTDDFLNIIENSINSLNKNNYDFDMLFIENNANHVMPEVKPNYGEHIIDNIYEIDPGNYFYGTAGIIIKNKNIDKIINLLNYIEEPIDQKIQFLGIEKKLTVFIMNPLIVEQHHNMNSLINV